MIPEFTDAQKEKNPFRDVVCPDPYLYLLFLTPTLIIP